MNKFNKQIIFKQIIIFLYNCNAQPLVAYCFINIHMCSGGFSTLVSSYGCVKF